MHVVANKHIILHIKHDILRQIASLHPGKLLDFPRVGPKCQRRLPRGRFQRPLSQSTVGTSIIANLVVSDSYYIIATVSYIQIYGECTST